MYRLYEKVPKSEQNEFGMRLLDNSENPFKEGPCLVSLIAIAIFEKNINGALNYGMEALRLKTNHNENAKIELEDFDGRILSISYGEPSEQIGKNGRKMIGGISGKKALDEEFTKKYFFPLIEDDGKRIDTLEAMRNMRNVNIMTYCDATLTTLNIERYLKKRMNELGYSEQETSQIQSQMCIIPYATGRTAEAEFHDNEKIESTCISFGDVNDPDVNATLAVKKRAKENNTVYYDEGYYFNYGSGEHGIENYILKNPSLSIGISSVLTKALSNSIENASSNEFKPISRELLTSNIDEIIVGVRDGKSKDELMHLVDCGIDYKVSKRKGAENSLPIPPSDELSEMFSDEVDKVTNTDSVIKGI